jgi:hypothetical protein
MKKRRKISEIWEAIDNQRPADITKTTWHQSFDGVKLAIEYIGYLLITTRKEFDTLTIPKYKSGRKHYSQRKIIVSRNGILSKPTLIESLLSGNSKLLTIDELTVIQQKLINDKKNVNKPKGAPLYNDKESNAINKLHALLDIDTYLDIEHLLEHRKADIAYRFKNEQLYVADQVKSGYTTQNRINFNVTIGEMFTILQKNMSLTCIAMKNDKVEVVWFFYGINAIDILNKFDIKKLFKPNCHLTCQSDNPFTLAINNPQFRYDVRSSESEVKRLLQQKLNFVETGVKHSLQYYNEDDSQIMCASHRIEHKSFAMTRDACAKINVSVKKIYEDNYTCVDFRMNDTIRIQDKSYKNIINIRARRKYPYNPDSFEIFQCSNLLTNEVYAIPMRYIENDIVKSTFTVETLMKNGIAITTKIWHAKYGKYKYDLKNEKDIRAYVETCKAAAAVPELTDRDFYKNMIDANTDQFGPSKRYRSKKNTL